MVTDPIKNIVTNPAHLWGHSLGQGFQDGRTLISLPWSWSAIVGRRLLLGTGSLGRGTHGKPKPATPARRVPAVIVRFEPGTGSLGWGIREDRKENSCTPPAVVPTSTRERVFVGHGNSIHCHSGKRNCPDVSGNSQIAQHGRRIYPACGANRLDPAMKADRHVNGEPLHARVRHRAGAKRSGYSGVLGDDGPGSAGGRMPASAPVSSGSKAAGAWIPTSAPVSVSCFGT